MPTDDPDPAPPLTPDELARVAAFRQRDAARRRREWARGPVDERTAIVAVREMERDSCAPVVGRYSRRRQ